MSGPTINSHILTTYNLIEFKHFRIKACKVINKTKNEGCKKNM